MDSSRRRTRAVNLLAAGLWLLAAVWALLLALGGLAQPVWFFDEAIALVSSSLVQQGLLPHRDFWILYPPLSYYLIATAFSVFGSTVLAPRLLQIGFYAAVLICAALFLRHRFRSPPAAAPLAFLGLVFCLGQTFLFAVWIAYALGLLALLCYVRSTASDSRGAQWSVLTAGILTGLATLSRANVGVYVTLAVCIDLAARLALRRTDTYGIARPTFFTALVLFAGPVIVAVTGLLIAYGPEARTVIEQVWIFPQTVMRAHRFMPLPPTLKYYLPVVFPAAWVAVRMAQAEKKWSGCCWVAAGLATAFAGLAWFGADHPGLVASFFLLQVTAVVTLHLWRRRLNPPEFVLLVFFCLWLHYFFTRPDKHHFAPLLPLLALLAPNFFFPPDEASGGSRGGRLVHAGFAVFLVLPLLLFEESRPRPQGVTGAIELLRHGDLLARRSDSSRVLSAGNDPGPWRRLYPDADELETLRFVHAATGPSDAVYVGVKDHSRAYANNLAAYWLLGRRVGVRHLINEPGLTTEPDVQRQMIADLERNRVRWVLLMDILPGDESFRRRGYVGSSLLDTFLHARYQTAAQFGPHVVLRLREPSPARLRPVR